MVDYFALLEQPRRPWLEVDALECKYYQFARQTHPDAGPESAVDFAQLNEGYRTLRDPKSRLEHLLALERKSPPKTEIPADLSTLFMQIASGLERADATQLDSLRHEVDAAYARALERLRQLSVQWDPAVEGAIDEAEELYQRFAFLTRWQTLLRNTGL